MTVYVVVNAEPVETRRARTAGQLDESVENLIAQAQENPKAILYVIFTGSPTTMGESAMICRMRHQSASDRALTITARS